jgi:hypothetical protein
MSSVAGGKVPVQFKVFLVRSSMWRWEEMPHALSVEGGCAGAAVGVFSSEARLTRENPRPCVWLEDGHLNLNSVEKSFDT